MASDGYKVDSFSLREKINIREQCTGDAVYTNEFQISTNNNKPWYIYTRLPRNVNICANLILRKAT